MTMHWTIRTLLLAVFFASLAWAAEVHKNAKEVEVIEASPKEEALNTDISGPEQKVISVGNVEGLGVYLVQISTMSYLMLVAVYIVYNAFLPPVNNRRSLSWNPWDMVTEIAENNKRMGLLMKVTDSIESINSRLHEEERDKCRKLTLCMLGSVTSGYSLAQSFFQVIRPAVPLLDNNWEGLVAGQAREDCNVMYERCPIGILSSFFRPNPPAANATTTTTTTSTPSTTSTTTTPLPRRTSTLPPP
ncbi:uncharacterized protein LOC126983952 isoform X2 [Eriocheir sinensis]|uniref:uncharacterized protein LOC126983952 isoform X2 n=1 Tax=Eriocheir sinensis TaxID=95602 RepID=UPI0021CA4BE4|nr:uncharacterized protein LOC126983952 isoform X2 [Eriocheir sinensis]